MKDSKERREYFATKQREKSAQRRAAGFVPLSIWVRAENRQAVKDFAESLDEKKGF